MPQPPMISRCPNTPCNRCPRRTRTSWRIPAEGSVNGKYDGTGNAALMLGPKSAWMNVSMVPTKLILRGISPQGSELCLRSGGVFEPILAAV